MNAQLRIETSHILLAMATALFALVFSSHAQAVPRLAQITDPVKTCGTAKLRRPSWKTEWTQTLQHELREQRMAEETPARIEALCPNYKSLNKTQREKFWEVIMVQLAQFESSFDTNVKFGESFTNSQGKSVISRGLFQLSEESTSYYDCNFENECQLHDPKKNIACAVNILKTNVKNHDTALGVCTTGASQRPRNCGASAYWGPFRKIAKVEDFQEVVKKKAAFCGRPSAQNLAAYLPNDTGVRTARRAGRARSSAPAAASGWGIFGGSSAPQAHDPAAGAN